MRLCLYEDRTDLLAPLSLTRPVWELRCGLTTLAEKHARAFAASSLTLLIRPHLAPLSRMQDPDRPVNDADALQSEEMALVNGRWLPPEKCSPRTDQPHLAVIGDDIAYAVLPRHDRQPASAEAVSELVEFWKTRLPLREAGGWMIRYPWDLIEHNGRQIVCDFPHAAAGRRRSETASVAVVGPLGDLFVDPAARVEPMVVADTTGGPVIVDRGAVVTAFTRLEGPCYIGPHSHLLGAKIRAGTSIGPHCRIGGEVEATIVHGYTNKYHEGFLGHSYVGEWVNLAAGTHNSDLRNDYGEVSVTIAGRPIATGLTKVGCFIGDHSKTGLGTLINTGTTIGAFCNLLPAGPLAPRYLPSFTNWWNGVLRESFDCHVLLETAHRVMQRRSVTLTAEHEALYHHLFTETAAERRRSLREAEQRHLRRTA